VLDFVNPARASRRRSFVNRGRQGSKRGKELSTRRRRLSSRDTDIAAKIGAVRTEPSRSAPEWPHFRAQEKSPGCVLSWPGLKMRTLSSRGLTHLDGANSSPLAQRRNTCRKPPNEARHGSTDDARRPAPRDTVAMALLRKMPAPLAARLRRACDPVGRWHFQRQAEAICALHRVRPQRGDHSASGLGRRRHWLPAVPGTQDDLGRQLRRPIRLPDYVMN